MPVLPAALRLSLLSRTALPRDLCTSVTDACRRWPLGAAPACLRSLASFVATGSAAVLALSSALVCGLAHAQTAADPATGATAVTTVAAPRRAEARALIREALDTHPAVLAARQAQDSARFDVEGARWQFYPTPSIAYEATSRQTSAAANQRSGVLRLQQPLWTGGRLTFQLDRARANEQVSGSAVDVERRDVALRIIQALGELRTAALKRLAYRRSGALHVEYQALVQRRVAEGLSPQGDVVLARSRLVSVRADLEAAQVQQAQALNRLELLLGRSLELEELAEILADARDDAGADWANPGLEALLTRAAQASPALQRALFEIDVRRTEVDLARSSLAPQVSVRAEHARGSTTSSASTLHLSVASNFGPGLSDRSGISAALRRVDSKQAELEARRRDVADQVRADYLMAESSERRLQVLSDAAALAADVLVTWRRQFLAGRKTWQDLMNAAREKAQADVQLAETRSVYWAAVQRLRIAADGLDAYLDGLPAAERPATLPPTEVRPSTPSSTEGAR